MLFAFWLLPLAQLMLLGGQSRAGSDSGYWQVLSSAQYLGSLAQTCVLAIVVTFTALLIGGISGVFLARQQFFGRSALVALLTFPLAFPGVVVGFLVILLAGRQGLLASLGLQLAGERWIFAYSLAGLFVGYLYFSIPRVILTVMAACESLDRSLEEAAHSLGAGHWRVVCDVIVPGLAPALGTHERAHFYKWMAWLTNTLQATLIVYFYPWRWVDLDNAAGAEQVRRQAQRKVNELVDQLDAELARHGGPWFLGEHYSALDPFVFTLCRWTRNFDEHQARTLPHLGPYLQRMLARPAVQRALASEALEPPFV